MLRAPEKSLKYGIFSFYGIHFNAPLYLLFHYIRFLILVFLNIYDSCRVIPPLGVIGFELGS